MMTTLLEHKYVGREGNHLVFEDIVRVGTSTKHVSLTLTPIFINGCTELHGKAVTWCENCQQMGLQMIAPGQSWKALATVGLPDWLCVACRHEG